MTATMKLTSTTTSRARTGKTPVYQRPKVDIPSPIVRMDGSRSDKRVSIFLDVDGHRVPYIEGGAWISPEVQQREEYASQFENRAPELRQAIERGEPIYDLWLDNRFGLTVPESELERWAEFLAHAMAVAAGYTSHGQNSRIRNPHGPSRL